MQNINLNNNSNNLCCNNTLSNKESCCTNATLSAPTNVRGIPGNKQISLYWDPPKSDCNSEILDYYIEYTITIPNKGKTFPIHYCHDISNEPYLLISNLINGYTYSFRVAPINRFGLGQFSEFSPDIILPSSPTPTVTPTNTQSSTEGVCCVFSIIGPGCDVRFKSKEECESAPLSPGILSRFWNSGDCEDCLSLSSVPSGIISLPNSTPTSISNSGGMCCVITETDIFCDSGLDTQQLCESAPLSDVIWARHWRSIDDCNMCLGLNCYSEPDITPTPTLIPPPTGGVCCIITTNGEGCDSRFTTKESCESVELSESILQRYWRENSDCSSCSKQIGNVCVIDYKEPLYEEIADSEFVEVGYLISRECQLDAKDAYECFNKSLTIPEGVQAEIKWLENVIVEEECAKEDTEVWITPSPTITTTTEIIPTPTLTQTTTCILSGDTLECTSIFASTLVPTTTPTIVPTTTIIHPTKTPLLTLTATNRPTPTPPRSTSIPVGTGDPNWGFCCEEKRTTIYIRKPVCNNIASSILKPYILEPYTFVYTTDCKRSHKLLCGHKFLSGSANDNTVCEEGCKLPPRPPRVKPTCSPTVTSTRPRNTPTPDDTDYGRCCSEVWRYLRPEEEGYVGGPPPREDKFYYHVCSRDGTTSKDKCSEINGQWLSAGPKPPFQFRDPCRTQGDFGCITAESVEAYLDWLKKLSNVCKDCPKFTPPPTKTPTEPTETPTQTPTEPTETPTQTPTETPSPTLTEPTPTPTLVKEVGICCSYYIGPELSIYRPDRPLSRLSCELNLTEEECISDLYNIRTWVSDILPVGESPCQVCINVTPPPTPTTPTPTPTDQTPTPTDQTPTPTDQTPTPTDQTPTPTDGPLPTPMGGLPIPPSYPDQHFGWPPHNDNNLIINNIPDSQTVLRRDVFDENIALANPRWTLFYIEKLEDDTVSAIWVKRVSPVLWRSANVYAEFYTYGSPVGIEIDTSDGLKDISGIDALAVAGLIKLNDIENIKSVGGLVIELIKWVADNRPAGDGNTRLLGAGFSVISNMYMAPENYEIDYINTLMNNGQLI